MYMYNLISPLINYTSIGVMKVHCTQIIPLSYCLLIQEVYATVLILI